MDVKFKKINIIALLLLLLIPGGCGSVTQKVSLEEQFSNPRPGETDPWTFWYWMYGAVSKEGITADLEAMHDIGLGGAYLMPIRSNAENKTFEYAPAYDQLTPEWWELVRFSMEEADRLGLKMGMHICDGFALAGGPWITPETSMQKVVWSDTIVDGGELNNLQLSQPESYEGFYQDIALFAVPFKGFLTTDDLRPVVTSNTEDKTPGYLSDRMGSETFRSSEPCWIQYAFEEPFLSRSIHIVPGGNNFQAQRMSIHASDDGINFRQIKELVPPRQGWQNGDENFTYSIPATEARYFRFYWDPAGTEPGAEDLDAAKWRPNLKVDHIFLSSEPRINQFEGKNGSVWRVSRRTSGDELPDELCIAEEDIISIPSSALSNHLLNIKLPEGRWKIVRMGHTATGHMNATAGGGKGLECDKFSPEAVKIQLDNWFGAAFEKTDPVLARRVLKYMHVDSWECGSQNWSDNFLAEFQKRRGYDLSPYLLVYTGMPVGSAETTEAVLHDIRQTIAELVVDVFYATVSEFARDYDCELSAECVSPTMVSDGMMHYREVDRPMGEFWLNSPTHDKFNDMLDAISGAHIYGKNIIQGEGFTQLRTMWNENPRIIKPLLDRNYALGLNKIFHHVYVHNPYIDKYPGVTLDGIGLYFQRDQTWWDQSKAWIDYIKRSQTMLQHGKPVVDIAVFTGEETPRRAVLPERLINSLPGIFGEEKVSSEKERLANVGQPLRVKPVGVTHSAGVTDAGAWIDALKGYKYDSFNKDVLLNESHVKNGKLVTSGGMEYAVLILPKPYPLSPHGEYMSIEVAEKIKEIQEKGVTVLLGDRPNKVPGYDGNNEDKSVIRKSESRLKELMDRIWSVSDEYLLPYNDSDFSRFGLEKDIDLNGEEDIAWTHRAGDGVDIYFISNQKEEYRNLDISFRSAGKQPEIWNPVTGEMEMVERWIAKDKRTQITLDLAPYQSLFIVFKDPLSKSSVEAKSVSGKTASANTDNPDPNKTVSVSSVFGQASSDDSASGKKTSDNLADCKFSNSNVLREQTDLITGEWSIRFERDDAFQITRNELFDWSSEKDKRIRYYSGTALYSTIFQFDMKPENKKIYLDLGNLPDLADVYVNDIHCGTAWTYPDRVEITKALQTGSNRLNIRVVNGWANRIKGVHDGEIKDENIWTNATYWIADQPLQPSGLLGPLTLTVSDK